MLRYLFFISALLFLSNLAAGQRVVRGTVTRLSDEKPLQGTVVSTGKPGIPASMTDQEGRYQINVPAGITSLKFKKKGFKEKSVEVTGSFVDVNLEEEPKITKQEQTDTISVLSKGVKSVIVYNSDSLVTLPAAIGFEITENPVKSSSLKQVLNGDNLNPSHQVNINNILAGKVAGLKISGQSGMALGRTGSISLRGPAGLSTGEGPSYYLDGTMISDINDIPYRDIKSVTILTGPSSAALLGSNGRNGAILITTADENNGIVKSGIIVNSGIQFSTISILPEYQNSYAGGYSSDLIKYTWEPGHPEAWKPLDGKYYHDYSDDSSWGPAMAGQEYIPWYAWYEGTEYTGKTARLNPQPDNIRKFYKTGIRINNSLTFYNKSDKQYISATAGGLNVQGNIPYTSLNKYYLALRAEYDLTARLTFSAYFNFFTTLQSGEINDNYGNVTTGDFNSWYHRDLESDKLRKFEDYRVPGTPIISSWNHGNPTSYYPEYPLFFYAGYYHYNPYTYLKIRSVVERTDRMYGKASLKYKILKFLDAEITYRGEGRNWWTEEKVPRYNFSGTQTTNYDYQDYYLTGTGYIAGNNFAAILKAEKYIRDFTISLAGGMELWQKVTKTNGAKTSNGLIIPGLYSITNSRDKPSITNGRSSFQTRSLFLRTSAGYKEILYFDLVLRREWHSTLPPEDNAVTAKSLGGSFIFSRLISIPFLNFGKVRFAWGEIPSGLMPYQYPGINYTLKPGNSYYYNNSPYESWNGNNLSETPNMLSDKSLRGSVKKENEAGFDLVLLNNRITFGFTWWKGKEDNIPVALPVADYSGFSTKLVNSGIIERAGYDLSLSGYPLRKENISWQAGIIFSRLLSSDVVFIGNGIERLNVQFLYGSSPNPSMYMITGRPWGELHGGGITTKDGKPLLKMDGSYISDPDKNFGSVYPEITGGIQNELRILKNISLNMNFDYQFGGSFYSLSHMWGTFSGLTARTDYINDRGKPVRFPLEDGGGVHVTGLDKTSLGEVDYYVEAQEYFHNLYINRTFDTFIFDASYIKLRELSISYYFSLGKKRSGDSSVGLEVTLYGENLLLVYATQHNFDPSELSYASGEKAQFPSVRSFGTNLRFEF